MNDKLKQRTGPTGGWESSGRTASGNAGAADALADRAHRVLRQLPGRRAPSTLAPRVISELARRAQLVWYKQPWTDWPESLRWLSTLLLAGVVAGGLRLIEGGWTATKTLPVLTAVHDLPVFLNAAETSMRSILSLLQALPPTWWMAVGCTLGILVAGTLGLGTAALRLVRSSTH